jgi:SnoaL-like polyketide cyclase.
MTKPADIAEIYIAAWNETDPKARRALIADTWTADAVYVDPMAAVAGHDGVATLIAGVQERFPGFRFALIGDPDGHGEHVRFSWGLGPDGQDAPIKGTDYVRLEDGRLKSVTGFLDQVPG